MRDHRGSGHSGTVLAESIKTQRFFDVGIHIAKRGQRRKVWELWPGASCSVVGTCLTLKAQCDLARKLAVSAPGHLPEDYEIHSFFARAAGSRSPASRLLHKHLDKTYATWIRRIARETSDDALYAVWTEAVKTHEVSGAYWAIVTHPITDERLFKRLFADVHMMSHLANATTRDETHRIRYLERQVEDLKEALVTKARRHDIKIEKRDQEIATLKEKISMYSVTRPQDGDRRDKDDGVVDLTSELLNRARADLSTAEIRAKEATKRATVLEEEISALQGHVEAQKIEIDILESALNADLTTETRSENHSVTAPSEKQYKGAIQDKVVLYVGGRSKAAPRLRTVIEQEGGKFSFHDGGLEQSQKALAAAIHKADLIAFPTDCISHEAVFIIKKICAQSLTPYIPLRTGGTASLLSGLRQWAERQNIPAAAE